jgi:hypothetical protein
MKSLLILIVTLCSFSSQIHSKPTSLNGDYKLAKGNIACVIPNENVNASNALIFIHSRNIADKPATLFAKINNFESFPVNFQVQYSDKDLREDYYELDKVYTVLNDQNDNFQLISFECQINGVEPSLLSKIANNLDKVKVEFEKKEPKKYVTQWVKWLFKMIEGFFATGF